MKLALLICLLGVSQVLAQDIPEESSEEMSFEEFEEEFNEIVVSEEEKEKRKEALEESEKEIREGNKRYREGKQSWKEGLNELSDVPKDEMKNEEGAIIAEDDESARGMGLVLVPEEERIDDEETQRYMNSLSLSRATPSSYDSTKVGLVTPVRNQKQCGSCAAFSTVAAAETCMLKGGAKLNGLDLSEQDLLNCAYNGGSINGCNGADPISYGRFFAGAGGGQLPHEYKEPYENKRLNCINVANFNTGSKVANSYGTYSCGEDKMKTLVHQHGAVVAAINADILQNYKGGIVNTCTKTNINHAVVVVGYGTENGQDYWKVRNSWGENWGEKGYFRIRRGTNECGIAGICVAFDCSSTGRADPAPTTQAPPTPPKSVWCDLTKNIGAYSSPSGGFVTINFPTGSKKAVCNKGVCRKEPLDVNNNGCTYFLG